MDGGLTPEQAHALEQEVVAQVQSQRASWVPLAGRLAVFHRAKGWEALGIDSFDEWIGQPEISLSRGGAYQMMRIWRELVEERGVAVERLRELDQSKVAVVLPAVRRGERDLEDALADVVALSRSDLRESYQGTGEATYRVCPECGSRVRESDESGG